jgi:hypothetical protein
LLFSSRRYRSSTISHFSVSVVDTQFHIWPPTHNCTSLTTIRRPWLPLSISETQSELLYDWLFTANQFVLVPSPLRPTTNIFFQLNTCGYSAYVTFSLTRRWACHLQLLMLLASAVILKSESRGTHDYILLPQIRDFHNLKGQVPVFISPSNRVAQSYPPGNVFTFRRSYNSHCDGGCIDTASTGVLSNSPDGSRCITSERPAQKTPRRSRMLAVA